MHNTEMQNFIVDYNLLEKQIEALYRLAPAARQSDQGLIRGIVELLESINERKGD